MTSEFKAQALTLMKARLNRLQSDTSIDTYLSARIEAEAQALEKTGIVLKDTANDLLLVVDAAVWSYQNRDKAGRMPEWLRLRRRERWISEVDVRNDT